MTGVDHLIVGAGSAGCVLAARLSEDPGRRVSLLEAGPEDRAREIHIPLGFQHLIGGPLDWDYRTDPEDDPAGRARRWPRGRVVGGCSSMNAMIWVRGHPDDYRAWGEAAGAEWDWEAALPFLRRMEDHELGESPLHGSGGPMRVESLRYRHPLSSAFVSAAREAGMPAHDDLSGVATEGVGFYRVNQRRGRRWSAARGYLDPARSRSNLEVRTESFVRRLVFDGRTVVGVEVERGGARETILAREVIVAAGAVGSPHLLLRSGIGPADALREKGVTPVVHRPRVGRNLQDHPVVPVTWRVPVPSLIRAERSGPYLRYHLLRRGMLASNVAEAGGFVRTRSHETRPDVQLHFAPAFLLDHGFANPEGDGFTIGPTLVRPASRGRISLASPDPHDPPRIAPGTLSEEDDVARLVEGVRIARRIAHRMSLAGCRAVEHTPGPDARDEAALAAFVRAEHQTLYHPTSTCAMGTDEQAVVDPHLRVRGVDGLRVVDASVMPVITAGNTQVPTLLIAERAAGWIRAGE